MVLLGEKAMDSTTPHLSPKTKPKRSLEEMSNGQSRILCGGEYCVAFTMIRYDSYS